MNTKTTTLLFIICLLICGLSCDQKTTSAQNSSANGIWQQEGYGFILEIKDTIVTTYDFCEVDCHESFKESIKAQGEITFVTKNTLKIQDGLNEYRFKRLTDLPILCQKADTTNAKNPVQNFNVLWHTINEHYCYFEERNIDWKKTYDTYRSRVTESTTDFELFIILKEMLESTNDGHVKIETPDELRSAYKEYRKKQNKEKPSTKVGGYQFYLAAQEIAKKHLSDQNGYNAGMVNWGMLEEEVLYIQINFMMFLSDYNYAPDLTFPELAQQYFEITDTIDYSNKDEITGISKLMKSILEKNKAKSCILDIRFNGGGKDEVSLAILNHFTTKKIKIASKKTRLGNQYSTPLEIFIEPSKPHFAGDLYVLTSHRTSSAAELFTMGTLSLPQATLLGSNTEGIFSDMLDKTLPNGWGYSLSNEVFLDNDGNNYEHIGIPPTIVMDYPRVDKAFFEKMKTQIETKDQAIETVLGLIKNKNN